MSERKLASIQRIKELNPIEGADKIEQAVVLGWSIVTQKGQHKVGDLVVFYEIDSFLPASDPRYESFKERFTMWDGKEGMRLKTIKLRKTLSQGLIMPVRNFTELANVAEGDDVTEVLKIEKWEVAEKENTSTQANPARSFPAFLRKTDQERVQNYGHLVVKALDEEFEATVKKDGSSCTVFVVQVNSPYYAIAKQLTAKKEPKRSLWQKFKGLFLTKLPDEPIYGICSRNNLLSLEGDSNFHKAAKPVIEALKLYAIDSVAIQGEVVAPNIQGNYEKVKEVEFHVFDMFNIDNQKYFLPFARQVEAKLLGLKHVTVLGSNSLRILTLFKDGDDIVQKCLDYAEGPGDNPGVKREGIVFKSTTRDFSFKAISNSYLLHKKD